jgi:hypothetical protein
MAEVSRKRGLRITLDRALGERLSAGVWRKLDRMVTADGAVREEATPPQKTGKRYRPKSEPAIALLKHLYPPDGCPPRDAVSDSALERAYHEECDRRGIHKKDRASKTQLLRCARRKE